jgi:hypothetical protein
MTLLVLSVGGCNSGDSASANNELSQSTSTTGAASPTGYYYEKEVDGRIYVVGSKEAAQKLDKGDHPTVAVTKIGYGPDRETVVFEADKSEVEKRLMAEYNRRHKK